MSWDLYVLPLAAGDDPRDALDRLEAPGSLLPPAATGQREQELAEELRAAWPEAPIDVTVTDTHVTVHIPYRDLNEHGASVTQRLTSLVGTVVDRTGWSVYDPQAGRLVTVDELPRLFVQELHQGTAPAQASASPAKHRKRLFGIF